jgi:hypothetical protein
MHSGLLIAQTLEKMQTQLTILTSQNNGMYAAAPQRGRSSARSARADRSTSREDSIEGFGEQCNTIIQRRQAHVYSDAQAISAAQDLARLAVEGERFSRSITKTSSQAPSLTREGVPGEGRDSLAMPSYIPGIIAEHAICHTVHPRPMPTGCPFILNPSDSYAPLGGM